jgi:hypothetical protein
MVYSPHSSHEDCGLFFFGRFFRMCSACRLCFFQVKSSDDYAAVGPNGIGIVGQVLFGLLPNPPDGYKSPFSIMALVVRAGLEPAPTLKPTLSVLGHYGDETGTVLGILVCRKTSVLDWRFIFWVFAHGLSRRHRRGGF